MAIPVFLSQFYKRHRLSLTSVLSGILMLGLRKLITMEYLITLGISQPRILIKKTPKIILFTYRTIQVNKLKHNYIREVYVHCVAYH
jgi:hypothetical protein